MQIQKFVAEALEAAMAAPPPTTRKAAYRIQKLVLVGKGPNDASSLCNSKFFSGLMSDNV
jgi:hypothetical protein